MCNRRRYPRWGLEARKRFGRGASVIGGNEVDIFFGLPYGFGKNNFSRN
jgi:hypothetical protein